VLANQFIVWRTIAHEVGHTLGLRHGGWDHDEFKGPDYLSLMSYSHQLWAASPVNSYSDGTDVNGFDDWSNLDMKFQLSMSHVGNSLGLDFGDTAPESEERPSLNPREVEEINVDSPIDYTAPAITILSPGPGASISVGASINVNFTASDPAGVQAVYVFFDLNGDGTVDVATERFAASVTGTDRYSASVGIVGGPNGTREVRVTAVDAVGNVAEATVSVQVTGGVALGDANGDGRADAVDYAIWQTNYGRTSGVGLDDGDFNGDGKINGADYTIWADHYDPLVPAPQAAAVLSGPRLARKSAVGASPESASPVGGARREIPLRIAARTAGAAGDISSIRDRADENRVPLDQTALRGRLLSALSLWRSLVDRVLDDER
jgi:hypothetical protein